MNWFTTSSTVHVPQWASHSTVVNREAVVALWLLLPALSALGCVGEPLQQQRAVHMCCTDPVSRCHQCLTPEMQGDWFG
jgi:hypothetical protein